MEHHISEAEVQELFHIKQPTEETQKKIPPLNQAIRKAFHDIEEVLKSLLKTTQETIHETEEIAVSDLVSTISRIRDIKKVCCTQHFLTCRYLSTSSRHNLESMRSGKVN